MLLAYFITFHTYGSWLHGRDVGSVDDVHNVAGRAFVEADATREQYERKRMKQESVELNAERRFVVEATIREVCAYRGWKLLAIHVRSTHVHVIVAANRPPERVMNDFKAYATRRMREAGVLGAEIEPWSHHGSTRYLKSEVSSHAAMRYVVEEQGEPLTMTCPAGWAPRA